ncbi:MAG: right-handed parallel beta-helix repeat-containing protein, partial [Phycisphaerae bacterium]|nr:right-handed parallel beta-helix repeat-containing protein [Phycisphaerae bacterium]
LSPVVYVDKNANGVNNGTNWANAYKELRDALADVNAGLHGCANQIWVADGNYAPTDANDPLPYEKPFAMIDGIDIYGHFKGNETSIDQRNLADSNNDTVLTGDIDDNNTSDVYRVVTAADSRIDGFTVKKGYNSGIYCNGNTPTIANCVIKNNNNGILCEGGTYTMITNTFINNNNGIGIYCNDSSVHINIDKCTVGPNNAYGLYINFCNRADVTDSVFSGNGGIGITAINGSSSNLFAERCDISDNGSYGINCDANVTIKRCTIQRNSSAGILIGGGSNTQASQNIISNNNSSGVYTTGGNSRLVSNLIYRNKSHGIEVYNNSNTAIINNTIVNNDACGISGTSDPCITSSIIWDNNKGSFGGGTFTKVNYNCIQNYTGGGTNINRIIPVPVHGVNDVNYLQNITKVSAGWKHSLALI